MKSSKARTLDFVSKKISLFSVPEFIYFKSLSFQNDSVAILKKIQHTFKKDIVVVRSSAASEDGANNSAAGAYDSVLNVSVNNLSEIKAAVDVVLQSYKNKGENHRDEVIVQKMISDVSMSGVIFTHELNTGAPYYVINYDDKSGLTDTVTSGDGEYSNRTLYIHRNSKNVLRSDRFTNLLNAVKELENVMESEFLDIEFALGNDLTPYLLQVRSITNQPNWNRAVKKRIDATLDEVQNFVLKKFKKLEEVYGETTVLGQMPDWNPVEMIGRAPRSLAFSLYQTFITDHVWRIARRMMGYKVPVGQPLMLKLAGQPFIDTRLSFHSYLPEGLSSGVCEKVVNKWVSHLKLSPELHDKVEFDIAITAYSFDIDEKIEKLIGNVLNNSEKEEFKQAHLKQTKNLVKGECDGSIQKALKKINLLEKIQKKGNAFDLQNNLSSLFKLVDDCINFGTIPFSILARHAFIAKTLLLSLEQRGIITNQEVDQIQGSVQTVASELVDDILSLQNGTISYSKFMKIYGHLRPGTYDIMSSRYDQMKNIIDESIVLPEFEKRPGPFKFKQEQRQKINKLLAEDGFNNFNADNFLEYVYEAIVAREYSKFVFTRSISDILELVANFAKKNGLSRNEISHVPINTILDIGLSSNGDSIENRLRSISEKESMEHETSVSIRLPQILTDPEGVHVIPFQVSHPNFITQKKIIAPCVILSSGIDDAILNDKIVIIEGADPGFDWIFSQKISGLITKYGGANSHMAIRCAEFGIPAAIGCGEQRFEQILRSSKVHLDCAAGLINIFH